MLNSLTAPLVERSSPLPAFLLPSRPFLILKQREQKPEGINTQEENFGKKDRLGWEEKSLSFLWLQQSTKCRRHFLSGARWAAPWGQGLRWRMPACPAGPCPLQCPAVPQFSKSRAGLAKIGSVVVQIGGQVPSDEVAGWSERGSGSGVPVNGLHGQEQARLPESCLNHQSPDHRVHWRESRLKAGPEGRGEPWLRPPHKAFSSQWVLSASWPCVASCPPRGWECTQGPDTLSARVCVGHC